MFKIKQKLFKKSLTESQVGKKLLVMSISTSNYPEIRPLSLRLFKSIKYYVIEIAKAYNFNKRGKAENFYPVLPLVEICLLNLRLQSHSFSMSQSREEDNKAAFRIYAVRQTSHFLVVAQLIVVYSFLFFFPGDFKRHAFKC